MSVLLVATLVGFGPVDDPRLTQPPQRQEPRDVVPISDPGPLNRLALEIGPGLWRDASALFDCRGEGGKWSGRSFGRTAGHRTLTVLHEWEYGRVYASEWTRTAEGCANGAGWHVMLYAGKRATIDARLEVTTRGVRTAVWVSYFAADGLSFGIGYEPLANRVFLRGEFAFREWFELLGVYDYLLAPRNHERVHELRTE